MKVTNLVSGGNENGNTDSGLPPAYEGQNECIIQVDISGSATVEILGRLTPDYEWVRLIAPATAGYIQPITYCPEIRVTISGYASGTVDVGVLTGG